MLLELIELLFLAASIFPPNAEYVWLFSIEFAECNEFWTTDSVFPIFDWAIGEVLLFWIILL